jgi:hypothetical protein
MNIFNETKNPILKRVNFEDPEEPIFIVAEEVIVVEKQLPVAEEVIVVEEQITPPEEIIVVEEQIIPPEEVIVEEQITPPEEVTKKIRYFKEYIPYNYIFTREEYLESIDKSEYINNDVNNISFLPFNATYNAYSPNFGDSCMTIEQDTAVEKPRFLW